MVTAKLSTRGQSQTLRLPKAFQFGGGEVLMKKIGDAVVLFPKNAQWDMFLTGLAGFSGDFMEAGRGEEQPSARASL